MKSPMKVLIITKNDFGHERDGGAQRVSAIVRALEARGCSVEHIAVRPFYASGVTYARRMNLLTLWAVLKVLLKTLSSRSLSVIKWYSPRSAAAVHLTTQHWKPDVTVVEYSQLAPYACITSGPRIIDLHNIESVLLGNYAASSKSVLRSRVARYEAAAMWRVESRLHRDLDAIAFVSAVDRATLQSCHEGTILVDAPNGVRSECFASEEPQRETVVFVGHLGWRPNIDAAHWLVEEVWPHVRVLEPAAKLQLIGRSPAPSVRDLAADDIDVVGDVASTIPYVTGARVATAPLLAAGGTRLKILEALASGTPVVATTLGALGIEDVDRNALAIEDEAYEFAKAIVARWRATKIEVDTRSQVEHYRWDQTLNAFVDVVFTLGGRGILDGVDG